MWNDQDDKILDIIDSLIQKDTFPCECPICKERDAHVYMHGEKNKIGSAWVWCGTCKNYSHFSYRLPSYWKNIEEISLDNLYHSPDNLNKIKDVIDAHINNLNNK